MDKYFRSDGNFIYSEVPYVEFYVPMSYFSLKTAIVSGNNLSALGLFHIGIFKNGKIDEYRILKIPTFINLYIYESEERVVSISDVGSIPCMVLKYIKNQKVMDSFVIEDSEYAYRYLELILKGKIPKIPYSKALEVWMDNQKLNNVNFGVPASTLELILAVAYRDKNDFTKKFSTVIGKDKKVSEFDYATVNIRSICQYASTFSAMTFEDFNSMVTTSINRTVLHKEESDSPVEDIIKY